MTFSKVHFSGFATVKIVWMWTLWQELPNLKIDLFWGDINNNRNFKPIGSSKSQIFGCWTSTYNLHSNKKLKIEFATTVHNKYFSTTKSEALTKYTNLLDHKMEITSSFQVFIYFIKPYIIKTILSMLIFCRVIVSRRCWLSITLLPLGLRVYQHVPRNIDWRFWGSHIFSYRHLYIQIQNTTLAP